MKTLFSYIPSWQITDIQKTLLKVRLSTLMSKDRVAKMALRTTDSLLNYISYVGSWSAGIAKPYEGKAWIKETTAKLHRQGYKNPAFIGEFERYIAVVCWMVGNKNLRPYFRLFLKRLEKIGLTKGWTWAFAYAKEAFRLTVRALAGSPECTPTFKDGEIRVARDAKGLPKLLPYILRLILSRFIELAALYDISEIDDSSFVDLYPYKDRQFVPAHELRREVVGILTVMSIFRVFKTKVTASLASVIEPFGGISRKLPYDKLNLALRKINYMTGGSIKHTPTLSVGKFVPHRSTKAGPNGSVSVLSAGIDALAFIHEPKAGISLLRWMIYQKAFFWIALFITIIVIFGPIYLFFFYLQTMLGFILAIPKSIYRNWYEYFTKGGALAKWLEWLERLTYMPASYRISVGRLRGERGRLSAGALSVVYDQAGKARVIAKLNWWIQSSLHGLHDQLYAILSKLPTDGTFNQERAFDVLLARYANGSGLTRTLLSGFDLSAATDRLPIDVQVQILENCGLPGELWRRILDITFVVPVETIEDLEEVKYSVGQPMGAYSSWAMLALMHHVLVQYSAINSDHLRDNEAFYDYAVLGDDVVIAHNITAKEYLVCMSTLGVKISTGKSVISPIFTEFAKKLKGPGFNISPIGPGAVLAAVRSPYLWPNLFLASMGNIFISHAEVLDRVSSAPHGLATARTLKVHLQLVIWQLLGVSSPLGFADYATVSAEVSARTGAARLAPVDPLLPSILNALLGVFIKDLTAQINRAHIPLQYILEQGLFILVSSSPTLRVLETLMKPINPGFWMVVYDAITAPFKIQQKYSTLLEKLKASGCDYMDLVKGQSAMQKLHLAKTERDKYLNLITVVSKLDPHLSLLDIDFTRSQAKSRAQYYKMIEDHLIIAATQTAPIWTGVRWENPDNIGFPDLLKIKV